MTDSAEPTAASEPTTPETMSDVRIKLEQFCAAAQNEYDDHGKYWIAARSLIGGIAAQMHSWRSRLYAARAAELGIKLPIAHDDYEFGQIMERTDQLHGALWDLVRSADAELIERARRLHELWPTVMTAAVIDEVTDIHNQTAQETHALEGQSWQRFRALFSIRGVDSPRAEKLVSGLNKEVLTGPTKARDIVIAQRNLLQAWSLTGKHVYEARLPRGLVERIQDLFGDRVEIHHVDMVELDLTDLFGPRS